MPRTIPGETRATEDCASCPARKGQRHFIEEDLPRMADLGAMVTGDVDVTATDGCVVESDGRCYHGHTSWLMLLGFV